MVSEILAAIAVAGGLTGAALNAIRAWYQAPEAEKFSVKKFFGGLASGGAAALGLIAFSALGETVGQQGLIGLFVTNLLLGVGTSTLVAKAHEG